MPWSSIPPSPGARARSAETCRGTTPSSTRRTYAASPSCIRRAGSRLRGTSAGLVAPRGHRPICASLGVTSVELLPIHTFINDSHLLDKGLTQLLGLQHDRLLRARSALLRRRRLRCANSRRWWRACTTPASRSFSTSSTTTPPRATSSARRCRSRASTTPATTGCCPTSRATTSTTPAPATR